ncbi:RmlC-like cupin domain-containing protein [Alternaria rosae]|uniref:RmlC-like cupin domain-containing protein n=1 Tax=Alternaria rosae TaxID=1187941 RepID=UPI001E8DF133|nr:RmlC-like cupin domain-containing protein [Alternaria rosae]KAH6868607.1 RmlC-like cupin domain-containing protein [Alternaria rosae]
MTDTPGEHRSSTTYTSYSTTTKTLTVVVGLLAIILAFSSTFRSIWFPAVLTKPTTRAMSTAGPTSMKLTKRGWSQRGHADHDWLYTYHTFSFASYYDPRHESFGPLRVINEDRVKAGTGFGTHSHAEFLIFSYIVNGVLEHKDSMGNLENLKRGEVQFTSAGTGIRHSEYNRNTDSEVHFLQIWAKPNKRGLKPHYETKKFTDEEKADKLVRIMESTDRLEKSKGAIGLQADLSMDASILSPGKKVVHELVAEGPRKLFAHVVMGGRSQPKQGGAQVKIGDTVFGEGDGAYIEGVSGPGKIEIESVGDKPAEFLLFDMGPQDV